MYKVNTRKSLAAKDIYRTTVRVKFQTLSVSQSVTAKELLYRTDQFYVNMYKFTFITYLIHDYIVTFLPF